MLELKQDQFFEVDSRVKVGHMRCDFVYGSLSNQWFPTELNSTTTPQQQQEIQDTLNDVQFNKITNFDKIVELCDGKTGYDIYKNLFTETENFNYWIRLNPVKSDYSMYIHVYFKKTEDKIK